MDRTLIADLVSRSDRPPRRVGRLVGVVLAVALVHVYLVALLYPEEPSPPPPPPELTLENLDIEPLDGVFDVVPPPPGFGGGRAGGGIDPQALRDPAVVRGLRWLARHQAPSGCWGIHDFAHYSACGCQGAGLEKDRVVATALALQAFLAAGEIDSDVVDRGLQFLMEQQRGDGGFGSPLADALAAWALCEAHELSADPALKNASQRALDHVVLRQLPGGGWGLGGEPDLELTAWHALAMRSALRSGLRIPQATRQELIAYLDSLSGMDASWYGSRPASAAALHCRALFGGAERDALVRGTQRLTDGPGEDRISLVQRFHTSRTLLMLGGLPWREWHAHNQEILQNAQDRGSVPCHQGSWSPAADPQGQQLGRIGATSLSLMILEAQGRSRFLNGRSAWLKDEAIRDAVK